MDAVIYRNPPRKRDDWRTSHTFRLPSHTVSKEPELYSSVHSRVDADEGDFANSKLHHEVTITIAKG